MNRPKRLAIEPLEARALLSANTGVSAFSASPALEEISQLNHGLPNAAVTSSDPKRVTHQDTRRSASTPILQPGDANQDFHFDQRDLVQVLAAGKYLSGEPAGWAEGDWNRGPGGTAGEPPLGDGVFDQADIMTALRAGFYSSGAYAAIAPHGMVDDEQTSIIYDPATGEIAVDAPAGRELTTIVIRSASGIFSGQNVTCESGEKGGCVGLFDNGVVSCSGAFAGCSIDNFQIFKATFGNSFGSISFGNRALMGLSRDFVTADLDVVGSLAGGGDLGPVDLVFHEAAVLGDSDQDGDFDQLDIVQVLQANKYLTGEPATLREGDWNGDGVFDQLDIVAALQTSEYLQGPQNAIATGGLQQDGLTSVVYDASTGELWAEPPRGREFTAIVISSMAGIFNEKHLDPNCGHWFGGCPDDYQYTITKATFGGSFGRVYFGEAAETGRPEEFMLTDLTVRGSLANGGDLGEVDLIYVPIVGDSNHDARFNQLDIVQVLQENKYLTAETATFDQGDWNHDGFFDQLDIVTALHTGQYRPTAGVD